MRPIDADALIEMVNKIEKNLNKIMINQGCDLNGDDSIRLITSLRDVDTFKEMINKAPTVEERPRGEWIMHDDEILGLSCECSACHIETCGDTPFCPNCGADMRGEE